MFKMDAEDIFAVLFMIYILFGVYTFGHAWNNPRCDNQCKFITSVAIPFTPIFYWSVELQRKE